MPLKHSIAKSNLLVTIMGMFAAFFLQDSHDAFLAMSVVLMVLGLSVPFLVETKYHVTQYVCVTAALPMMAMHIWNNPESTGRTIVTLIVLGFALPGGLAASVMNARDSGDPTSAKYLFFEALPVIGLLFSAGRYLYGRAKAADEAAAA